jgi:hypothetical protein
LKEVLELLRENFKEILFKITEKERHRKLRIKRARN